MAKRRWRRQSRTEDILRETAVQGRRRDDGDKGTRRKRSFLERESRQATVDGGSRGTRRSTDMVQVSACVFERRTGISGTTLTRVSVDKADRMQCKAKAAYAAAFGNSKCRPTAAAAVPVRVCR